MSFRNRDFSSFGTFDVGSCCKTGGSHDCNCVGHDIERDRIIEVTSGADSSGKWPNNPFRRYPTNASPTFETTGRITAAYMANLGGAVEALASKQSCVRMQRKRSRAANKMSV